MELRKALKVRIGRLELEAAVDEAVALAQAARGALRDLRRKVRKVPSDAATMGAVEETARKVLGEARSELDRLQREYDQKKEFVQG